MPQIAPQYSTDTALYEEESSQKADAQYIYINKLFPEEFVHNNGQGRIILIPQAAR